MSFIKFAIAGSFKTVGTANVFRVFRGGAWKDVEFLRVYKIAGNGQGSWKDAWVRAATVPAPAPAPAPAPVPPVPIVLNVAIAPSQVNGVLRNATGLVTTNRDAVVTVSNGTGPYIYTWQRVSWSYSIPPNISLPDAAATRFTQQINEEEATATARFRCLVQDSLGNLGSAEVDATFLTTVFEFSARDGYRDVGIIP